MIKHKNNDQMKNKILTVMVIVVTVAIVVLTCAFAMERERSNLLHDDKMRFDIDTFYKISRITFCYDNNIHPCSDDAITIWNNAHPENTFNTRALN